MRSKPEKFVGKNKPKEGYVGRVRSSTVQKLTSDEIKTERFAEEFITNGGKMANAVRSAFPEYADSPNYEVQARGRELLLNEDVHRHIQSMREEIRKGYVRNQQDVLADAYSVFEMAMQRGNVNGAVAALTLESKILGFLDTKVNVNVTHQESSYDMMLKRMAQNKIDKAEHIAMVERNQTLKTLNSSEVIEAEIVNE